MLPRKYGCVLSTKPGRRQFAQHPLATATRPPSADAFPWEQWQPGDHNQGDTGSCVGNATACAMQALRYGAGHTDPLLSADYVYQLARQREGTLDQDAGCEPVDALTAVQQQGISTDALDPLSDTAIFSLPDAAALADGQQRAGIKFYQCASFDALLTAMGTLRGDGTAVPGLMAIAVYPGFETPNPDGTFTDVVSGELLGYHYIVVRFYDDSAQVVRIRNSWGAGNWTADDEATLTYAQVALIAQEFEVIAPL